MKKLIVTAVAIAMGFAAQAASYSWGYEGYLNNGDGAYGVYAAYRGVYLP